MSATFAERVLAIEAGYEFSLAYAAQGRTDDAGTTLRQSLEQMYIALKGMAPLLEPAVSREGRQYGGATTQFLEAVKLDIKSAQGAIGLVLDQSKISSLLVDNLNASVHLRALLTDLFLIDQARQGPP